MCERIKRTTKKSSQDLDKKRVSKLSRQGDTNCCWGLERSEGVSKIRKFEKMKPGFEDVTV